MRCAPCASSLYFVAGPGDARLQPARIRIRRRLPDLPTLAGQRNHDQQRPLIRAPFTQHPLRALVSTVGASRTSPAIASSPPLLKRLAVRDSQGTGCPCAQPCQLQQGQRRRPLPATAPPDARNKHNTASDPPARRAPPPAPVGIRSTLSRASTLRT